MKNRDRIRQYDSSLHVHFGSTGERRAVTALSLNDSLRFAWMENVCSGPTLHKGKIMSVCLKSSGPMLWLVMLLKQCNMRSTATTAPCDIQPCERCR
jgi:uncharacterized membrane protein